MDDFASAFSSSSKSSLRLRQGASVVRGRTEDSSATGVRGGASLPGLKEGSLFRGVRMFMLANLMFKEVTPGDGRWREVAWTSSSLA